MLRRLTLICALAAAAALPALAFANDSDVRRLGQCTKSAFSKIKLSPENGQIEVEFEVDASRIGQTWRVVIRRNGKVNFRTRATTRRPSGSFTVRRVLDNRRGAPDNVNARAVSPTEQICRAAATLPPSPLHTRAEPG